MAQGDFFMRHLAVLLATVIAATPAAAQRENSSPSHSQPNKATSTGATPRITGYTTLSWPRS